jgi:FkbM family methyltransferase
MPLLRWLDQQPATHFAIDRLGGRRVADAILGRVPANRRLEGSGVRYRHRSIDTFMTADEIFGRKVYEVSGLSDVRTFADLGCNVGLFVAWLAHKTGRRDLRGLAVDANPRLVDEVKWVVRANGLSGVHAVTGLIGAPGGASPQDFYLSPVSLRSSRFPDGKGEWRKVSVPSVDIEERWRLLLGDVPCQLLKMDIEGGEADFLRPDNPFWPRVEQVILEWHGWVITEREVEGRFNALSFEKLRDLSRGDNTGIAHYRRIARAA